MNEIISANETTLPSISQLLINAWSQLKQHWRTWLMIMILPTAVMTVGDVLLAMQPTAVGLKALTITCLVIGNLGIALGVLALVNNLLFSLPATRAWDQALGRWLPFVWLLLLNLFFNVGGLCLFIVPALLYMVWFSLAVFCFAKEDQRGLNALWRSRELFRGVFWRMVGRYLVALLIMIAVSLAAGVVFGTTVWGQAAVNLLIMPIITGFSYAYLAGLYLARIQVVPLVPNTRVSLKVIIVPIIGLVLGGALILFLLVTSQYQQIMRQSTVNTPQDMDKVGRDLERQLVAETVLQPVLSEYYANHKKYPAILSMTELGEWLTDMPLDPQGGTYKYEQLLNGQSYRICPQFEQRSALCFEPTTQSTSTK